jgi:hypothetical protein
MSLSKLALATCLPTDLFFKREPHLIVGLATAPNSDFTMGSAFTRIATPKNRTDRDQQRIQIGKKPAQTEHGSLFSKLPSSSNTVAIGRGRVLCAVGDHEYRETPPCNDSHLVTLVPTIDEILCRGCHPKVGRITTEVDSHSSILLEFEVRSCPFRRAYCESYGDTLLGMDH